MYTKKLSVLIPFILLLNFVGPANATYTDYIGAGHNSGVSVATCINDGTAKGSKTVDGSGLSGPSGTHDIVWDNGWLAYTGAANPNPARSGYAYWIRFNFGEIYSLADMWIWNSNEDYNTDRGFKNVYIDYSLNGSSWTQLINTQFSEATGLESYLGFQGPDFGGASARYVLISAVDNWGAEEGWYGLAEVKFNINVGPPDTDPPTPNPPTWQSPPAAPGPWAVSMTANTVTDPSGVEYYFDETTGNFGGWFRDWEQGRSYTNFGLQPETQYTYRVQARDMSANQNTGGWSTSESATTAPAPSVECPEADLDDDCDADIDDAVIFAAQWLDGPGCAGHPEDCADLNEQNDGVDGEDFAVLAADWQDYGIILSIGINEFMADNETKKIDPADNEYEDWIEIYNASPIAVDMSGMYIKTKDDSSRIPSGVSINPNQFLLFWADKETEQGPLHLNVKIDKDGDSVTLYETDGVTPIDTKSFNNMAEDVSLGRFPDGQIWYDMPNPTPALPNTIGMAEEVYFSRPAGTFTSTFSLGLTTKSPTATIYYTTNGSEPTDSSTPYTTPFSVTETTWVRARAYDSGITMPSPITSAAYIKLHTDVANFQTNLPIVVIDTFNFNVDFDDRDFHPVISAFIDTDQVTGNAIITDPADYAGYGGMHVRGQSSFWEYPKKQYRFEVWDEEDQDKNVSLLGMPADSDWIIHAPYSDKTLMRNYQIYNWSREIDRYAVRTRFVELFMEYNGDGQIEWDGCIGSKSDYRGVYVFMEKIKRDRNRIDLAELSPSDNLEPEITGGYVLDKGGEEHAFETTTYSDDLSWVDPEWGELTTTQRTWSEDHFNEFESALDSVNYNNPAHANYYGNYIDIGSFVDHHILVEFGKNVDGFVLSTYLFKDRGGKINMGPIWDYNGALGGADYICNWLPEGWLHEAHDEVCCPDPSQCCAVDSCWRYPDPCDICEGSCSNTPTTGSTIANMSSKPQICFPTSTTTLLY
jgi:hypothetical protein